jgi:hypothetical protein
MDLQLGTWNANFNGHERVLTIDTVDAQGQVTANSGSGVELVGFWDNTARKLTLSLRPLKSGDPAVIITGYLFPTPPTPAQGQDVRWTLAGHFELAEPARLQNFPVEPAGPRRNVFGWFATTMVIA